MLRVTCRVVLGGTIEIQMTMTWTEISVRRDREQHPGTTQQVLLVTGDGGEFAGCRTPPNGAGAVIASTR